MKQRKKRALCNSLKNVNENMMHYMSTSDSSIFVVGTGSHTPLSNSALFNGWFFPKTKYFIQPYWTCTPAKIRYNCINKYSLMFMFVWNRVINLFTNLTKNVLLITHTQAAPYVKIQKLSLYPRRILFRSVCKWQKY